MLQSLKSRDHISFSIFNLPAIYHRRFLSIWQLIPIHSL